MGWFEKSLYYLRIISTAFMILYFFDFGIAGKTTLDAQLEQHPGFPLMSLMSEVSMAQWARAYL